MEQRSQQVNALLRHCGMAPLELDFATMTNLFLGQMRIGFYGGVSSIPMRPTYLTPSGALPLDSPVAVAQINDREIRTALVTFHRQGATISLGESFPVPGVEYPAPLEDLLYAVAELLAPLLETSKRIALCLPGPLEKTPDGDGAILRPPQHMRIDHWEGRPLAGGLEAELSSRGIAGTAITLVSSASAAQLGGMTAHPQSMRCLGLTWGHGIDSCFSAPQSAILKLKSGEKQLMLLDTGSGSFTGVPFGTVDLILDRDSAHPGEDLLDKSVSTHHLGELFRLTMIKAVEGRLLTYMCGREFLSLRRLELSAVTRFLAEPKGDNVAANFCRHDDNDRDVALAVARAVLERSARLVCANLAAVLLLTGAGRDKDAPALMSLYGEAFQTPILDALFREQVQRFIAEGLGRHCMFHTREDLLCSGSAAAALLNPQPISPQSGI